MINATEKPITGLCKLYLKPVLILLIVPLVLERSLKLFKISSGSIENLIGFFAIALFYVFMLIKEKSLVDGYVNIFDEIIIYKIYLYIYLINALFVALIGLLFKICKFFPSTVRAYTFFCAISALYTIIYAIRISFVDTEEGEQAFRIILRIGEIIFFLMMYINLQSL